jgi:crotonobetainyl-CoA:carnitine CoA-transferase CaiB-like acyl-CoA transferase
MVNGPPEAVEHPIGPFKMPSWPVRFDGRPPKLPPSPLLGQHSEKVFGEWLGMSAGTSRRSSRKG